MKQKKQKKQPSIHPDIFVTTLANGYSLSVRYKGKQPQEYLYFNAEELVKGMVYHVRHNIESPVDPEEILPKLAMELVASEEAKKKAAICKERENIKKSKIKAVVTYKVDLSTFGNSMWDVKQKVESAPIFDKFDKIRFDINSSFLKVVNAETGADITEQYKKATPPASKKGAKDKRVKDKEIEKDLF